MASILKQIQSELEAHLEKHFPSSVKIMSRLRGNVTNDIAASIAKGSMIIMVFPARIGGIKPNVLSAIQADDCTVEIRIVEAPAFNKSGVDAYEAAEIIIGAFPLKTSSGELIYVAKCESSDPDDSKVVEFAIELSFSLKLQKSKI